MANNQRKPKGDRTEQPWFTNNVAARRKKNKQAKKSRKKNRK